MEKVVQLNTKRLNKRELKILEDAMETLTIAILHDEYNYEVEELSNLHDKILVMFHQHSPKQKKRIFT